MSGLIEYENISVVLFRSIVSLLLLAIGTNGLQKRGYVRLTRSFIIPSIAIFGYIVKQIGDAYLETCGSHLSDKFGFTKDAADDFGVGYDECFKRGIEAVVGVNIGIILIFYGIYSVWFFNYIEKLKIKEKEGSVEFKKKK